MSTPRFIAVKLNGIIGMGINKKKKGGGIGKIISMNQAYSFMSV